MEWKKVKLGEVAYYVQTKSRHKELTQEDYISTENMLPNKRGIIVASSTIPECYTKFQPCDILISNIRPYFQKIWFANRYGGCSNDVLCIRGNEKVIPVYLYYLLSQDIFFDYVMAGSKGTKMPRGDKNQIMQYEFPLPPLETQRRIAAILSSLDDKIENNNRINRNLEAQAQALFKSWFVDFEPFGGKMPEDWKEGVIADLVNLLNGFAFKSSDFVENGQYKLITIKGVQDGKMTIDGADCLDMFPNKMPQWCQLQKGDILLSLTGNVGRCCLVDMDYCLLNQRVAKLQPKAEYNRLFVYSLFRQEEMKARMVGISRGTAQMNLSPVETGKLSIVIPSEEVLQKFGERYNGIIAALLNSIEESQRLAALRDTLLPKLMKGEIEV